ncbi:triphosphoribosyl-dephospho-CoA synthase [Janthinobacterium sp. K2C7]|uniref:triphosphoribosyl-dephospho-CoA synthase n=1 Tax=unclassified Janthinobacterium TaxID=2610881 RepID=UPI00161130E6|nr:triphosphoribosyl-dephospho-CoA synthase [Janthinobacterium sp. K2C7]MBB5384093.1 triphosphoribosyl-dephospho-CoA synthase [Janthinobacterium sp. K2Li3]MBB5389447.1 triphosphoribosyl-dephospho-CoA synthase [Janthinobacterium sp. K2E3]
MTTMTLQISQRQTSLRPAALARLVVQALLDEVTLTPKPGLVDLRSRGAHTDLNWALMCDSACVLQPVFAALADAGWHASGDDDSLRQQIGRLGRHGEALMMAATGGVNTHRGAIWALGMLVTAAAQLGARGGQLTPAAVAERAAALARLPDRGAPPDTGNKGELACRQYQVGGARGQAMAAFPHVVDVGLPCLRTSRARGDTETTARLNALLAIIAQLDDTCVLSRGGRAALLDMQAGAAQVLDAGGATSKEGSAALLALEAQVLERRVSPGGAADLLAATLFLDQIDNTYGVQHGTA